MQEVVDELVKGLTSEEFKGKLVVILAGYEKDMDSMLSANEGLRSRFPEKIVFEDFTPDIVMTLLLDLLKKDNMSIDEDVMKDLPSLCLKLTESNSFANGRDVHNWFKRIIRRYAKRQNIEKYLHQEVILSDICEALDEYILSKNKSIQTVNPNDSNSINPLPQFQFQNDVVMETVIPPVFNVNKVITQNSIPTESITEEVDSEVMKEDDKDSIFYQSLQTVLDNLGLNTNSGILELSQLSIDSDRMVELAHQLSSMIGITYDNAISKLIEWKALQLDVRKKLKEQEEEIELAKEKKRKVLVPIWRCGVCGRADKPYIVCYVQPFIVRYEEADYSI